jgi:hypothetical protein
MKKDSLRTFYMDPFAERFSISHARVAVCVDAPLWQTKRASLEKCISDELTGTDGNEQQPVRLASIGFADNLLAEIRRVGTASGVVTADESTDGMLLFQMPLRAAREGLARISDGGYTDNHCTGPITGP